MTKLHLNTDWLFRPQPITSLALLRILFGAMMLMSTLRFWLLGWIEDQYILPKIHFPYYGFGWLPMPNSTGMYLLYFFMGLSALCIFLGLFYRFFALVFFVCFNYVEFLDISYYLNHYYFVSLLSLLLLFVPASGNYSLDARLFPRLRKSHVPAWSIYIFLFQVGLTYFYAGVAKIHTEWLFDAMPLRIWLPANNDMPLFGSLFNYTFTAYAFSWLGMLFDLSIPFFLLWKKTRFFAYLAVLFFHSMTGYLFQIGVFPVVMSGMAFLFFAESTHKKVLHGLGKIFPPLRFVTTNEKKVRKQGVVPYLLGLYVLWQVLFPWRFLLYDGYLLWTEQGYRFSWRVMLIEKAGSATFYVQENKNATKQIVFNEDFLNAHQEKQMAMQPDMLLHYAHFLDEYFKTHFEYEDPIITADVFVTLNRKPGKRLVPADLDLSKVQDSFAPKHWLLPFTP